MNLGFCSFDGMTPLDFVGVYDVLTRLDRVGRTPVERDVCALTDDVTANGLTLDVDRVRPDLARYDLVFVPGGETARTLRDDAFVGWLRTADPEACLTAVCTGSLLLGAAGFLDGRRATTHPSAFETLAEYADVRDDRIVHDGTVVTGRGVSSSVDLGLYLVEVVADAGTREAIAERIDYPYGASLFEELSRTAPE